ncbi:hypothetical protein RRG08_057089 [Elysia crispata]|uniref:Uncharacterized protein n=1 Tax=Elysia crispata TaxID=231223 RepID=A0AAE1E277_9GAST|nr:hypothetical protein RRG08_057089 [Elysia crispata]
MISTWTPTAAPIQEFTANACDNPRSGKKYQLAGNDEKLSLKLCHRVKGDRQRDKVTGRQSKRQGDRATNLETTRKGFIQRDKVTGRLTKRQDDRATNLETTRKGVNQRDKVTGRQNKRQREGRQSNRQGDRATDKETR